MAKSKSVPMPTHESHSVSVRKIDNGFIVSKSSSTASGYKCSETFSPTKPKLDIDVVKPVRAEKPSMNAAVKRAGGSPKGK